MRKPISTKTHGMIDYVTVAKMMILPRVLGFSKTVTRGMDAIALVKLGYTLLTRHELGVFKVLPMKAHLAMDVAGGAMMTALPFMAGEEDETTVGTCVAMGGFDMVAAALTETETASEIARRGGLAAEPGRGERSNAITGRELSINA